MLRVQDVEMNVLHIKEDSVAQDSSNTWTATAPPDHDALHSDQASSRPVAAAAHRVPGTLARWLDSFRRADPSVNPMRHVATPYLDPGQARFSDVVYSLAPRPRSRSLDSTASTGHGRAHYDYHAATAATASSLLARELQGRHLQMIAIGGSIGTGLFVASGRALCMGGPGSVLSAYLIVGVMMYFTMQALCELAVTFPVAGSFSAFSTRFLHPSWGFAMGWNYALNWIVVLPLEIIAASITIEYWNNSVSRAVWITIFLLLLIAINLLGVQGYGEAEFVFAVVKVIAVVGFILLGIVINIGGTPNEGYIGAKYWISPGVFNNGFKGFCSTLVTAAFAFAGTELIGLAAAETANPRKSLPTAIKQVFWRITIFYVLALGLVGLLVPFDDARLLGATTLADAAASPFVIAIENAGIGVLPGIMNAVILVSVLSVGNSAVFGSSRTLAALADQRQAPRTLGYVDRRGRPLVAVAVAAVTGLLAYLAELEVQSTVLDWLVAIASLSSVLTWASICAAHVRFRAAWRAAGRHAQDLPFRAQTGVPGSWAGLACNLVILTAHSWTAAWPLTESTANDSGAAAGSWARNFVLANLMIPFVAVCYAGHKLWYRTRLVPIHRIDIDTGRRDVNLPILMALEMDEKNAWPAWKKMYKYLC